jgi:hypothetical protein
MNGEYNHSVRTAGVIVIFGAMRACKFNLNESSIPAKQMAVRRQYTIKNNNQPTMLAERGMQRAMNGRERAAGLGELRNKASN